MNNFLMLSQRRNKRGRLIEEGQGERERGREGKRERKSRTGRRTET